MLIPAWAIYALLSATFAGLVAIFAKMGFISSEIDNTVATTVRAIIMTLFLIIVFISTKKLNSLNSVDNKSLFFIALSGIAGAISWLFYFFAIKIAPFNKIPAVSSIDRLSIVFVFIFTILILGVRPNLYSLIGILLVSLGSILLSI